MEIVREGIYKDFDGWKQEDIDLWNSIDWKARNYEDYPVEGNKFTDEAIVYGVGQYGELVTMEFQKYIRPNPIFPPYYRPTDKDINALKREFPGYSIIGPMYDGNDYDGYGVHNRFETQEVYNALTT